jgi:hypothetical protein
MYFFASLAFLTRYAIAPLLFPVLLIATIEMIKSRAWKQLLLASMSFIFPVFISFYAWSSQSGIFGHNWLVGWNPMNLFRQGFDNSDGIQNNKLPNLLYVLKVFYYPGFSLIFPLLIYFFRKSDFIAKSLFPVSLGIAFYLIFLAGIPFQNDRFLIPVYALTLILFFPSFERMMAYKPIFKSLVIPVLVVVSFVLIHLALRPMVKRNHLEREIMALMTQYENQTLYSFDIDVALKGRGLKMNYINMWRNELENFEPGALVLFNEPKFYVQWRGKNPMINFLRMKEGGKLIFVRNLPQGWQLFRVQ